MLQLRLTCGRPVLRSPSPGCPELRLARWRLYPETHPRRCFLSRASPCVPDNKYRVGPGIRPPPMLPEDVPLPVQAPADPAAGILAVTLCFGDRVLDHLTHHWLDPLRCIAWPELYPGDSVLLVPQEGCRVLVNRQPTLVHPCDPLCVDGHKSAGVHARNADPHRPVPLFLCQLCPGGSAPR